MRAQASKIGGLSMFKAILNDEGMKVWGCAFPGRMIPINTPYPVKAKLGDIGEQEVYLVAWAALSHQEQELILENLMKQFHALRADVEAQIQEKGLPIRASYVSAVSMPARYF